MDVTIMRRVVPMVGVFAMLLALLVPQTTALAEPANDELDETEELDPEEPASSTVVTTNERSTSSPTTGTADTTGNGEATSTTETATTETTATVDTTDGDATPTTHTGDTTEGTAVTETTETVDATQSKPQCRQDEVKVTITDSNGSFDAFEVEATGDTPADGCYVFLESYLVPNSFKQGDGFGSTAVDQESFHRVKHEVTPDSDDTVAVDIPACGSYQVDAYGGKGDREGEAKDIVGIGGHHTGGFFLYNNAGKVYFQEACEVDLALAHWCAFDDGEKTEYIFRLDRRDENDDVDSVAYRVFDESGNSMDKTGTLGSGEERFFTVTDPNALLKVEWGEGIGGSSQLQLNGITSGSDGKNGTNDKPCGVWVTPEKKWDDLGDAAGPDVNLTLEADITDWPGGPWGPAHSDPDSEATVGGAGDLASQTTGTEGAVFVPFNRDYEVSEDDGPWEADRLGTFTLEPKDLDIHDGDWAQIARAKEDRYVHTVTNSLSDPEFRFQKLICDDPSDVRGNSDVGADDKPISVYNEAPDNCRFAAAPVDFRFAFGQGIGNNPGQLLDIDADSYSFEEELGTSTIRASDLLGDEGLVRLMENTVLTIDEVVPPDTSFGALQCFNDAVNDDNDERIRKVGDRDPATIDCVAWNIDERPEVTIDKEVDGDVEVDTEFEVCIKQPDLSDEGTQAAATDERCVTFVMTDEGPVATGTDATFRWPSGDYLVEETEDGGADTVSYAVNGESQETSEDAISVTLESGTATTITVTNTFEDDTPPTTTPQPPPEIDVEGETFEPTATIVESCIIDDQGAELVQVVITLDNSASTDAVTFDVAIDGFVSPFEVEGGETETITEAYPADLGEEVSITVTADEGDALAEATFDPADCLSEVEEEVVDREDDSTDGSDDASSDDNDDPVEVEVLGVSETLPETPETGASTLLLTVMGLLGIGLGTGALRVRRSKG